MAARIMRPISNGISLAATLMSPWAPTPMEARAMFVAGEDSEAVGKNVHQFGNLGQLAAGLLDCLDVGRGLSQAQDGLRVEVDAGAPRDIVERYRQRGHSP